MTSGERATAANDETQSADVDGAPVELLPRVKAAKPHDHRMLQHSASGRHGNGYHGNHKRRGSVQTMPVHRYHQHSSAPDKPLVRRKRIRRDGDTPAAMASKQAPALEQPVAPVTHVTTSHGRPSAELLRDKSKPKPGHVGKIHRRKFVHRRGRGGRILAPHDLIGLHSHPLRYDDHARDRKTPKSVGAATGGRRRPQRVRDKRRLMPDHRPLYRTRPGKPAFLQLREHRDSTSGFPDTVADPIHLHPATLAHRAGVPPRRRAPVSGSGERRRRLPVVRKSLPGGPQRQLATAGLGDVHPLKHRVTAARRPRIRTSDG